MSFRRPGAKGGLLAALFLAFAAPRADASVAAGAPDTTTELPGEDPGGLQSPAQAPPPLAATLVRQALGAGLDRSPVWKALLHSHDGRARIDDPEFLISLPRFTLRGELEQTIEALWAGRPDAVCRFPARYLWLRARLDAPALPIDDCADIVEFRVRAPADEISLVYASENLAQPASIHGHAFLKLAGRTRDGRRVAHAVSFYTDADDPNLPRLLFESLVTGKPGYFTLAPYPERLGTYVDDEQRTVWEYRLAFDSTQRELVGLHLLELRRARLSYFFHDYNCATVVHFVLGLSGRPAEGDDAWVTPRDLVRQARDLGLVAETRVIAPSRWMVRALQRELPPARWAALRERIDEGIPALPDTDTDTDTDTDPGTDSGARSAAQARQAFISLKLASAYNQYAYREGRIDRERWLDNDRRLQAREAALHSGSALAGDRRADPANRPGDSQLAAGLMGRSGRIALTLSWLPTSHTIDDDNRAAGTETELRLLSGTLRMPLDRGLPRIERFDLYAIESLLPRDPATGGISGRFAIAYEPHRDRRLAVRHAFGVLGALGQTVRPVEDVDLYALAGAGFASTMDGRAYLYPRVEAGAVVREIWSMKSRVLVARTWNQVDPGARYDSVALHQVRHVDAQRSVHVALTRDFDGATARTTWSVTFKRVF